MKKHGTIEQRTIKDIDGYSHPDIFWRLNSDGSLELQQHRDVILITKERLNDLRTVLSLPNSEQNPKTECHNDVK